MTSAELADNDFNLNIRRYVDNTPPPEPQDVRAHLHGGVPEAEVGAHAARFAAYGIDVWPLFRPRPRRPDYLTSLRIGWQLAADQIPAMTAAKRTELSEAFDEWWDRHVKHIIELPDTGRSKVMETRARPARLVRHRAEAARRAGPLPAGRRDRVLVGRASSTTSRPSAYHKFSGVVQGWLTTIEAAFDPEDEDEIRDKQRAAAEKRRAREHGVVPLLIPDYLNALEEAEARRADLDAQVKAATAKPDAEDDEDGEADDDLFEHGVSATELTRLKADLAAARSDLKRLEAQFLTRLKSKFVALDENSEERLVRSVLKADLTRRLEAAFDAGPRALADRYRTWAGKYAVPLDGAPVPAVRSRGRVQRVPKGARLCVMCRWEPS